jgi:hypothetical protein
MKEENCNHDFVSYKQCCYCGVFENSENEIIEDRCQSNVEALRGNFSDWYFGIKEETGKPPLAMQIFFWFENNLRYGNYHIGIFKNNP